MNIAVTHSLNFINVEKDSFLGAHSREANFYGRWSCFGLNIRSQGIMKEAVNLHGFISPFPYQAVINGTFSPMMCVCCPTVTDSSLSALLTVVVQ